MNFSLIRSPKKIYLALTLFLFIITSLTIAFPLPALAGKAKVAEGVVNIRSGPGTNYDIIGNLYRGTEVETGQTLNGWTEIQFKNLSGWIRNDLLEDLTAQTAMFKIKTEVANLRTGPGTNFALAGQAKKGDVFAVIEEKDGWVKIKTSSGTTAYVAAFLGEKIEGSGGFFPPPSNQVNPETPSNFPSRGNEGAVKVYLDGSLLSFEVPPVIENGRTLVPLRAIFEAMGATVDWNAVDRTVTAVRGNITVVLKIGSTKPTVNGQTWNLDVPAKIVNNRTLAPLRFVGEAFGGKVEWDGQTRTVKITSVPAGDNNSGQIPSFVQTTSLTNLRTGAGISFDIAEQVPAGEKIAVLAETNGWYQVSRGGRIAWVAGWVVEPIWNDSNSGDNSSISPAPLPDEDSPENTDEINQPEEKPMPEPEPEPIKADEIRLSRLRDEKGITVKIECGSKADPEINKTGSSITYEFEGFKLKGLNYIKEPVGTDLFKVKGINEENGVVIRAEVPYGIEYQTLVEDEGKTHVIYIPNFIMDVSKKSFGSLGERVVITTLTVAEYGRRINGDKIELQLKNVKLGKASENYRFSGRVIERVTLEEDETGVLAVIYTTGIGASSTGRSGDGNILNIMIQSKESVPVRNENLIVIDPGHGGRETGAISNSGYKEKIPNLEIALEVGRLLRQKGFDVEYTRIDDSFVGLEERAAIANKLNAAVFVSIHNNSSTNPEAAGTETYFYAPADRPDLFIQKDDREDLATYVQEELVRKLMRTNRGVKQANFSVLRNTKMPSILCEVAFLSNAEEEMLLKSDSFKMRAAKAIADGIERYMHSRR